MKSTKKVISVILAVLMLITCVSVSFTVNASTGTLCDKYATNPQGKIGVKKTITIDGSYSDWSSDMLIAQGAAWDVANHYKGGHENCVLDTYALYAAWDDNNLYVAWQMVNTTDTWAREGDGPLSDGGRVLDVPLILALSVDPSSTSMSNKNTNGGPIWGQKMGLTFNQHVDHLLYMSGKVGNGTPGMFTAVDAQGNTNYSNGLKTFKDNGIEYKMAEGNVSDSIIGLNYSEDTSDVYSNDADWVDYKTFKGSSGTHNTKYDSFYEIKIPLSTLGINSSYIENNGLGAMVVATRGESGLDCIPFDDTMLDNATGSYGGDASTSHEKDDEDVITSSFARIGNLGGNTPVTQPTTAKPTTQPTTAKPTTQPTTAKPTTQPTTTKATTPVSNTLTVNATSNFFPVASKTYSSSQKQVTLSYKLNSAMKLINSDWELKYDTSKLSFNSANIGNLMPNVSSAVINENTKGKINGNFSTLSLVDFSNESDFVSITFDVIGKGIADVDLFVNVLGVAYKKLGSTPQIAYVVDFGEIKDVTSVPGFEKETYTVKTVFDPQTTPTTVPVTTNPTVPTTKPTLPTTKPTEPTTVPVTDTLKVNATSNILAPVSQEYNKDASTVTVSYKLTSSMKLVNSQWCLTYDSSKLSYDPQKNLNGVMPNISSAIINTDLNNIIKGDFSSLALYDFTTEKDFVTVTFDIIGTGETTVDLDIEILGVAYKDKNFKVISAYPVDYSKFIDITSTPGFENMKLSGRITLNDPIEHILYGDVNNDGVINVADATLIQKYSADIIKLTDDQLKRADVNFDGVVNVHDSTLIRKFAADIISSFK